MPLVVAAPAAVVAALFAILFMLAWAQWRSTIVRTLSIDLPVVGNVIAGLVQDTLDATYLSLVFLFDAVLHPIVNMILGPVAAVENGFDTVKNTLDIYAGAIANLAVIVVPQTLSGVVDLTLIEAQRVLVQSESYAFSLFGSFEAIFGEEIVAEGNRIDAIANAIPGEINSAIAQLPAATLDLGTLTALIDSTIDQHIAAALGSVNGLIGAAYTQATGYASQLVGQVESEITADVGQLQTEISAISTGITGAVITDLDNAIAGALGGIYTDIDTAISDVVGVIGTGDADVLAGVRAIPTSIPLNIAGVASLAGATTLTLARYLRDCGIPNCQNLSQFGNELQDLLGIVGDASFLAFLVELIHDPTSAPGIINDTFGSVISDATSTAKSLLGV